MKRIKKTSKYFFFFFHRDLFGSAGLRVFFTKLLLYSLSPIGFSIVCYLVWIILFYLEYKNKMNEHKEKFKSCYITSMVVILFMLHPNIIQTSFSARMHQDTLTALLLGRIQ